jgi:uracil-DNA glycosylase
VTEQAIRALVAGSRPLVAILWRRDAATSMLEGVPYLESAHPSPLSASRGFFGFRPFSRTNELLDTVGARPGRLAPALTG